VLLVGCLFCTESNKHPLISGTFTCATITTQYQYLGSALFRACLIQYLYINRDERTVSYIPIKSTYITNIG